MADSLAKYRAGITGDFHRPACMMPNNSKSAAVRFYAMPTRNECSVSSANMYARLVILVVGLHGGMQAVTNIAFAVNTTKY